MSTLKDRFWKYVRKTSGCWLWTGTVRSDGYGVLGRGKRGEGLIRAHRFSWELVHGPVPKGMFVLHRCDNPPCVRPSHLFLGTNQDNVNDMRSKGRGADPPRMLGTSNVNAKLSPNKVREMRRLRESGATGTEIAKQFSVYFGTVYKILRGELWSHVADA